MVGALPEGAIETGPASLAWQLGSKVQTLPSSSKRKIWRNRYGSLQPRVNCRKEQPSNTLCSNVKVEANPAAATAKRSTTEIMADLKGSFNCCYGVYSGFAGIG